MRRLIDDLLSLTRIELNEHVLPLGEVVPWKTSCARQWSALAPLAEGDNIAISVDVVERLPPVTGERDELIQLFQNLIHNAIKYGRENGQVTISLRQSSVAGRRGSDAMVTVSVALTTAKESPPKPFLG